MSDLKYEDIVERLNDMVETVVEDCIPGGRRDGRYWRGDCHGKISVHITGDRVGLVAGWQGQFGSKTGSNLIGLIQLAYGCSTHGDAVRLAKKKYLGLEDRPFTDEEKRRWAEANRISENKRAQRQAEEERSKARKVDYVRDIWAGGKPLAGTLAEKYLIGRGVDLSIVKTWPQSLRFHPSLKLGDKRFPALIGGVQAADRKLVAVWRIFLTQDGQALTDPDGKKVKLGLGPASGGAVRLGAPAETIIVTEGIETAFGAGLINSWQIPVMATLSTSGMAGFVIPKGVKRLQIYADGDRHRMDVNVSTEKVSKPPGLVAAEALKARAEKEGVQAVIAVPPEPDDWLDVWNGSK